MAASGRLRAAVVAAVVLWAGLFAIRVIAGLEAHASALALWTMLAEAFAPAVAALLIAWFVTLLTPESSDEARLIASRGAMIHSLESAREALLAIESASDRQVEAVSRMARVVHAVEREGDRIESLFGGLREEAPALLEDARAVNSAWDRVRDQALRQADTLRATLREVREGGARVSAEMGVVLARQTRQIEAMDAASKAATAAIAGRAYALDAAVDGALARSEALLADLEAERPITGLFERRDEALAAGRARAVLATAGQVAASARYLDAPSPAREEAIYAAERFTAAFEGLLAALTPSASDALIRILLASDFGRLYLRLGARVGRFSGKA